MIEKIAIVADIHANKYALDKFLDYIDKEHIECILNIGDFVQIGPNPYEVSTKVLNDNRFIKPTPPDGWLYDDNTGTFYEANTEKPVYLTDAEKIKLLEDKLSSTQDALDALLMGDVTTTT